LITRALKNEKPMTELLELGEKLFFDRKWIRRKEPIFPGEQSLFGEVCPNGFEFILGCGEHDQSLTFEV
jgi:hypothetical protein